jgi:hypothetical protein
MENPVDKLLDKIRLNSVYLTNKHINNHLYYKHSGKRFEIPTIILSVFAGSFSVGADSLFAYTELLCIQYFILWIFIYP